MGRVGMSVGLVKAMKETFSAWDRDEYAYVSDAVLKGTGHAPGTSESWCRDHTDLFHRPMPKCWEPHGLVAKLGA